ncbi:hypothetical protein GCM10009574_083490 [Streptomyces asiaticus]
MGRRRALSAWRRNVTSHACRMAPSLTAHQAFVGQRLLPYEVRADMDVLPEAERSTRGYNQRGHECSLDDSAAGGRAVMNCRFSAAPGPGA